jgi:hypothetical protein
MGAAASRVVGVMARFTNGPDATDNPANIQTRAANAVSRNRLNSVIEAPSA